MNARRAWLAAGVILVAAWGGVRAQGPDANGVLAKAREALGGEKRLAAIRTIVIEGETRQVRGDNLVPIVFQTNIELPDRYSRRDETPATESGYTTSGFVGDALIQLPIPLTPPAAPQRATRVTSLKQDFTRLMLGMFAASQPAYPLTFTRIGVAESPQGKADVIEAKGPENFVARLLINQDTHLPVMLSWTAPAGRTGGAPPAAARGAAPPAASPAPASPAAAPPESRLFYADYRDVDGIQLPFRIRRAVGSETVEETTVDRYKLNAKIDPKKFEVIK